MRQGCFGSGSILRRNLPISTSTLRSNGSKRRLGVQQRVPADDPSWTGDERAQERELAACQGDRLAGFACEHEGVEIEDEARETHERRRFSWRLGPIGFRSVAHVRSSNPERAVITLRAAPVYKPFTERALAVYDNRPTFWSLSRHR